MGSAPFDSPPQAGRMPARSVSPPRDGTWTMRSTLAGGSMLQVGMLEDLVGAGYPRAPGCRKAHSPSGVLLDFRMIGSGLWGTATGWVTLQMSRVDGSSGANATCEVVVGRVYASACESSTR